MYLIINSVVIKYHGLLLVKFKCNMNDSFVNILVVSYIFYTTTVFSEKDCEPTPCRYDQERKDERAGSV